MFQTNPKVDPLVEVLRLAYRRGLAIRQEQEEKNKTVNVQPSDGNNSITESKEAHPRKESKLRQGK